MYAINHAATALILKKQESTAPIWPLLISVQLVELLWVFFNYLGIEHFSIIAGSIHLDYLPYSHSVFSGTFIAFCSFFLVKWIYKNNKLALLFTIGVLSHVIIDMIFHEKDIQLSPFASEPVWGLGIIEYPFLDFFLEFIYGLFCWWYFKGNKALLVTIIIFNMLDLPVMLASGKSLDLFIHLPRLLPTFILFQIFITWYFVAKYSKEMKKSTIPVN